MSSDDDQRRTPIPEYREGKSEEIFEVEKIVGHAVKKNVVKLKVRWLGYQAKDDTWEPLDDLVETANDAVQKYKDTLSATERSKIDNRGKASNKNCKKRNMSQLSGSASVGALRHSTLMGGVNEPRGPAHWMVGYSSDEDDMEDVEAGYDEEDSETEIEKLAKKARSTAVAVSAASSQPSTSASAPPPATQWTVMGIARDETAAKKILMKNSVTAEVKILGEREAFDLDGWTLTKYLLDHCTTNL